MKKGIIEAFEETCVIIEIDGETKDFPLSFLQGDAEVGDVVSIEKNRITPLKEETEVLRKEIEELMDELWED